MTNQLTFAQLMRSVYIDLKLQCGPLNRSDIASAFQISIPQASNDILTFQTAYPQLIAYDPRKRQYYRPPNQAAAYPSALRLQVQQMVIAIAIYRDHGSKPNTHRQRGGYTGGV
jgi:hypothetical protein